MAPCSYDDANGWSPVVRDVRVRIPSWSRCGALPVPPYVRQTMTNWTHPWTLAVSFKLEDGTVIDRRLAGKATSAQRASLRQFYALRDLMSGATRRGGRVTDFQITEKTIAGPREDGTGPCQVCGVIQALNKNGSLRKHHCFGYEEGGVGHLPLGSATDAVEASAADLEGQIAEAEQEHADLTAREIAIPFMPGGYEKWLVGPDEYLAWRAGLEEKLIDHALKGASSESWGLHYAAQLARELPHTYAEAREQHLADLILRINWMNAWLSIYRGRMAGGLL